MQSVVRKEFFTTTKMTVSPLERGKSQKLEEQPKPLVGEQKERRHEVKTRDVKKSPENNSFIVCVYQRERAVMSRGTAADTITQTRLLQLSRLPRGPL